MYFYLSKSGGIGTGHERVENDDGLVQIPNENAIQIGFRIGRRIWLPAGAIPSTPRASY